MKMKRKRTNLKKFIKEHLRFLKIQQNGGWEDLPMPKPSVHYSGIFGQLESIRFMPLEELEKRQEKQRLKDEKREQSKRNI